MDSKSNDDFRTIMEEAETGIFTTKKSFVPPAVSTKSLGTWEKHTKGIGMKLLNKFGFTGRLGAREDGVSRAIEVVVRPNGQGLGFGDFTESSALPVNKKLVAEWSGVEYKEPVDVATIGKKAKKNFTELIANSSSWKKNKKDKQPVKKVTVSDFLELKAADEDKKMVIIDMRGEQTRVLTDYSEIGAVPLEEENSTPKLGQELLYNINLVVELLEIDVTKQSRKVSNESQKVNVITSDIELLEMQVERDTPRLMRLESVMKILDKVGEKQKKVVENYRNTTASVSNIVGDEVIPVNKAAGRGGGDGDITLSAISSLLQTLHKNFTEEFHIFGLIQLLPSLISPVLNRMFFSWQPLEDPDRMAEIHTAGSALGDYFEEIGEHSLRAQTRSIVEEAAQKVTLPSIHRVLTNEWDVRAPDRCISLLEAVGVVYPVCVVEGLLDMMVMPKLAAAVKEWNPAKDTIPIHLWLHPWLPLMKSRLSAFYPEIRRKLAHTLSAWDPSDLSALSVIRPWTSIFDTDSMERFLVRVIVPKLLSALRKVVINPQNQDVTSVNSVLAWWGVIPHIHYVGIFRGEFFSKWLRVLLNWLSINPDFEEVSEWYSGWKSLFPLGLLEDKDMIEPFNAALNLMNVALMSEEDECAAALKAVGVGIKELSYSDYVEAKLSEVKKRQRLDVLNKDDRYAHTSTSRSGEVTFKDVVAAYAESSGVAFVPKAGREHEGKQIWLFGKSLCYLDRDVVFTYESENSWRPIGLEDLLKIS